MTVSTRYKDALIECGNEDENFKNLKILSELYQNEEFKSLLDNPRVSNEEKVEVIKKIVPGDKTFINFIKLLIKEERINLINDIYNKYKEDLDKQNKTISIRIVTANEISKEEVDKIVSKFKKMKNARKVEYKLDTDKNLIGGVKVICDGTIYDSTIRRKLNEILN